MSIDPRLIERRKTVAEDKAKRNVGRLLKFLVVVVMMAALVWVVFSPWLSVKQVETQGVTTSSTNSILVDRGVVAGTPMFRVNETATEAALLDDPWIETATVDKDWPNLVTVDIVERTPVAWTQTGEGWTRRSADGVALPSAPEPDQELARVEMPELADVAAATAPDMVAALEFIDALPPQLHQGVVVTQHDGELWATVTGFVVRLGRGVEMREKALSLEALLDKPLADGSILVLIAPTNPAVMTPSAPDDGVDVSTEEPVTGEQGSETGAGDSDNG